MLPARPASRKVSASFMVVPAWRAVQVTTLVFAAAVTGGYSCVSGSAKALMAAASAVAVALAVAPATAGRILRPAISMMPVPPPEAAAADGDRPGAGRAGGQDRRDIDGRDRRLLRATRKLS